MATLYITEYQSIAMPAQVPQEPPIANQTVAIGASSANSVALSGQTNLIRLHTDAICSVLIGTSPTATSGDGRMAANQTEYRGVVPGQIVAVITNT